MQRRSAVPLVLYLAWLLVSLILWTGGWVGVAVWAVVGAALLPWMLHARRTREERAARRAAGAPRPQEDEAARLAAETGRREAADRAAAEARARRAARQEERERRAAARREAAAASADLAARTFEARYMGGLPALPWPGDARVVRAADGTAVRVWLARGGVGVIPTSSILQVSLATGSRITSRGRSGLGGALVGDMVAGPVGAVVGGMATRRQQVSSQDDSAVMVRVETAPGRETTVMFKGPMGKGALEIYARAASVLAPAANAAER